METYRAAGPDSLGARWSLSGTDANRFALSNGVLSFRSSPNFEAPADSDSDNVYNVIVQASKGSLEDARNRDDQGHQQGRSGVLKPVVPAAGCRSRDYSHAKRP